MHFPQITLIDADSYSNEFLRESAQSAGHKPYLIGTLSGIIMALGKYFFTAI